MRNLLKVIGLGIVTLSLVPACSSKDSIEPMISNGKVEIITNPY